MAAAPGVGPPCGAHTRTHRRLVFFKTQTAAAVCAQAVIHGEDNREFQVRCKFGGNGDERA